MNLFLDQALLPELLTCEQAGRYRVRKTLSSAQQVCVIADGRALCNFSSNDYLGLAADPRLAKAMVRAADQYGVGSGSAHLVSGHSKEHHALEEELADFVGAERALLFSTGYMANLGVITALVGRGDAIVEDKLNHASLLDGGRLSGAAFSRFIHNDLESLTRQLQAASARRKLVAVDSVFSMDGDLAPLPSLATLCRQQQAFLMVDDAHGLGVLGSRGRGILDATELGFDAVPIYMGTLGKALGSFGAFVAGSHTLIESLIQFARSYIYTTALPPAVAAASRASLSILREDSAPREMLQARITLFKTLAGQAGLPLLESSTAIQPLLLGGEARTMAIANGLYQRGFWVGAIRPPTVPVGSSRLRITLTAGHSEQAIRALVDALVIEMANYDQQH